MRRLLVVGALSLVVLVAGGAAADTFAVTLVSQTNSTITLGWTPQSGYGYLFSLNGQLVSRTNDPSRSTVKFSKGTSYDIDVIVKGANGHYPPAPPPPQCSDGVDNDGDGKIDLADPGCTGPTDNDETNVTPAAQCADGLDNDSDGKIDYPADPGCSSATDNDETNTVPTGCAQTTPNVPDGPDGNGGCFPGPANTGPNAPQSSMAAYTGSCTITTANVTIDSKVINCDINVRTGGGGLTISNSYVFGSVQNGDPSGGPSFTIKDSLVDSGGTGFDCTDCEIRTSNFTILRSELTGTNKAAYCIVCTVQDNYIHTSENLDPASGAHASGMRPEQNATLRHNTIWCAFDGPYSPNPDTGCSADTSGYPDFVPIHHNTYDRNLFMAAQAGNNMGFCAYFGATGGKPHSNDPTNATYIVVTNNVFQRGPGGRCGGYGPVTDFASGRTGNVWQNNKYDNGTAVNP